MKTRCFATALVASVGLFSGCVETQAFEEGDKLQGASTLTVQQALEAGEECPNGGITLAHGIDTNANGQLDEGEATDTYAVCHGQDADQAALDAAAADIETLKVDLADALGRLTAVEAAAAANAVDIGTQGASIAANGQAITTNGEAITTNGEAITANGEAITANGDGITTNAESITAHGETISTDGVAITANAEAITANGNDLDTLEATVSTKANATDVAAQGQTLDTHGADIAANAAGVSANGEGITANGDAITANGEAIVANADGLEALEIEHDQEIADLDATTQTGLSDLWTKIGDLEATGLATMEWVWTQGFLVGGGEGSVDEQVAANGLQLAAITPFVEALQLAIVPDVGVLNVVDTDLVVVGGNVHVTSGTGSTLAVANGKGNLILGYDDELVDELGAPISDKSGSHNLVIGPQHSYPGTGGLVTGYANGISGLGSVVLGGLESLSTGDLAVVVGGKGHQAVGEQTVVAGGEAGYAGGPKAAVFGGEGNMALSQASTVVGGMESMADDDYEITVAGYAYADALQDKADVWYVDGAVTDLQFQVDEQVQTLEGKLDEIYDWATGLMAYVSVDVPDEFDAGPDDEYPSVIFQGANVHIRNGEGSTESSNGTGNLIVGYDEANPPTEPDGWDSDTTKTGSHNVIIGPYHSYASYGGLVAGYANRLFNAHASVSGGAYNTAGGTYASVSGGAQNQANGESSSVTGGYQNKAEGWYSAVSGGLSGSAFGHGASIAGGADNAVSSGAAWAFIAGGQGNVASADYTSITGGLANTASGLYASVTGGQASEASGEYASVTGGTDHVASGEGASVTGGEGNKAKAQFSSIAGGYGGITDGQGGSITGGHGNLVYEGAAWAVVSGGQSNIADGSYSVIAGGYGNSTSSGAGWSVVSGGIANATTGEYASVTGGLSNSADGYAASVTGGISNAAAGSYSSVSGGSGFGIYGDNEWMADEALVKKDDLAVVEADLDVVEDWVLPVQTFLTVDAITADVFFTGANVHIRNGLDATDTIDGTGNLIIGFDEEGIDAWDGTTNKGGSHNLVIGPHHTYASYGGLIAGYGNRLLEAFASVLGGGYNTVSGLYAAVAGGYDNEAQGSYSVVTGGSSNFANGNYQVLP